MSQTSLANPPVEVVGGVNLPGVPVSVTDGEARAVELASTETKAATQSRLSADVYEDTRINLTVEPGVTDLVPIARNYLNRIITPFESPKVITVNPIEFKKEGSSIFVTTTSTKPVGIHILPNDPEDTRSISLALVPKAIPPKTIRLRWPGESIGSNPGRRAKAKRWEESAPFVETVMALLTATAKRQIPRSYRLSEADRAVACDLDGIAIVTGQRLTGSHLSVYVARATNVSDKPIEIREPKCGQRGVAAIAAWPRASLAPGESTELYLAVINDRFDAVDEPDLRPSLLEASH